MCCLVRTLLLDSYKASDDVSKTMFYHGRKCRPRSRVWCNHSLRRSWPWSIWNGPPLPRQSIKSYAPLNGTFSRTLRTPRRSTTSTRATNGLQMSLRGVGNHGCHIDRCRARWGSAGMCSTPLLGVEEKETSNSSWRRLSGTRTSWSTRCQWTSL